MKYRLFVSILSVVLFLFALNIPGRLYAQDTSLKENKEVIYALGLFNDGFYKRAFDQLDRFLRTYPETKYKEQALFHKAESMFLLQSMNDKPDFNEPLKYFREFRITFPFSSVIDEAYLRMTECYYRLGKYDDALKSADDLISKKPESPLLDQFAYWKGEVLYAQDKYPEAIAEFGKVHEITEHSFVGDYALFACGWAYTKTDNTQKASDCFKKILSDYSDSRILPEATFKYGETLYYLGKLNLAIIELVKSLKFTENKDEFAKIYWMIGDAYYQQKNINEAKDYFTQVIEKYSTSSYFGFASFSMGRIALDEGNATQAERIFTKLTEPQFPPVIREKGLFYKGTALKNLGRDDEAVTVFNSVIKEFPAGDYADNSYYAVGLHLETGKKYAEALVQYLNVIESFAQSDIYVDVVLHAAECYASTGQYRKAISRYSEVLSKTQRDDLVSTAMYGLGASYFQLKQYNEAAASFDAFLQKYPMNDLAEEAVYWKAEALYSKEDLKRASEAYTQLISRFPNSDKLVKAYYNRGYCYFNLEDYNKAIADFKHIPESSELYTDANYRIADAFTYTKQHDKALSYYNTVAQEAQSEETRVYAKFEKARTLKKLEKYDDAIAELDAFLLAYAESDLADDAQFDKSWIYFKKGNYPRAIEEFNKLFAEYSDSEFRDDAVFYIGESYYNMKRYDDAVKYYQRILVDYPSSSLVGDATYSLCWCKEQQKRPAEAIRIMQDFIRLNPQNQFADDLQFKIGNQYFNNNEYDNAITEYQVLINKYSKSPLVPEAIFAVARAYHQKQDFANAIRYYSKLFEDYSRNTLAPEALLRLAKVYKENKDENASLQALRKLKERYPKSEQIAEALYEEGVISSEIGSLANAKKVFEEAITRFENNIFAEKSRVKLGEIYLQEGNYQTAKKFFESVISRRVDELAAQAQYMLGEMYKLQKNEKAAQEHYLKVRHIYPSYDEWVARATLAAAASMERTNDLTEAKRTYTIILKEHQNDEFAKKARERLQVLNK